MVSIPRPGQIHCAMDDRSSRGLVAMYETAIAELRNLHHPEVEKLVARPQAHQDRLAQPGLPSTAL